MYLIRNRIVIHAVLVNIYAIQLYFAYIGLLDGAKAMMKSDKDNNTKRQQKVNFKALKKRLEKRLRKFY